MGMGVQRGIRSVRRAIGVAAAVLTTGVLVAASATGAAGAVPDDVVVGPLASATTTDVVVSGRIAYERVPDADMNNPAFLEGMTFELYSPAGPGDAGGPGAATGYTCTIPSGALDCTIEVPDTGQGGANEGRRFYIVTTSAGASAQPITTLATGTSSDPSTLRSYPGLTPALFGDATVAVPVQGSGETLNSQVVAASLDNPDVLPACIEPLSLGILMDLSGSVNELQRLQYRSALTTMTNELADLPIEVSLSTFGSASPVDGRESGPYSLQNPADVAALNADITAFTAAVPGPTQQTNWDQALRRVADKPGAYDALLMLTDGAPNWVSNDAGTGGVPVAGSSVTIASIEQAVFSANAVKAEGTRILAMGIGNALSGDRNANLAAISGPTLGSDFFEGDWSSLTDDLRAAVADVVCTLPVTVTKNVVDAQGENPTPADGWSFTLATSDVSSGTATVTGENPQLTGSGSNATGQAAWSVSYSEPTATATITVTEAPQAGFTLVGAEYVITHTDGTETIGSGASTTLSIPGLLPSDKVAVTFTNAPTPASFQVRKVLTGSGAALVPADTTFTVDYAVNGVPADAPLVISADGTPVDGPQLVVGDEVTFTEQTPPAIAGVTWGDAPVIEPIVLGEEPVIVDVANTALADAVAFGVRKQLAGAAAELVPGDTEFTFAYTVNGEPAAEPLVVRADGKVVQSPAFEVGDEIVVTEQTPPAVTGVVWGKTPAAQSLTIAAGAPVTLTFTNTAHASGVLPVTGGEAAFALLGIGGAVLITGLVFLAAARRRTVSAR